MSDDESDLIPCPYWDWPRLEDRFLERNKSPDSFSKFVVEMAVYKILSDAPQSHRPQELKLQEFADRICRSINMQAIEWENMGYALGLRATFNWPVKKPQDENLSKVIENMADQLLKDPEILHLCEETQHILSRNITIKNWSAVAGGILGIGGAAAAGIYDYDKMPHNLFAVAAVFGVAGIIYMSAGGMLGSFASAACLFRFRNRAFENFEKAMRPKVHRDWIAAAMEQGYSRIVISKSLSAHESVYMENSLELISEDGSTIDRIINHSASKSVDISRMVIYPKNPEFNGSHIDLYFSWPTRANGGWGKKSREREAVIKPDWDLLPKPVFGV